MKKVIKKSGKEVFAYRLDEKNEVLEQLVEEGKIKQNPDGTYQIFSREAVNGTGEIAYPSDYIKIDSGGYPYPNRAEFFEKNHRHKEGNRYEQLPKPLDAWTVEDGMCSEVEFLMEQKGLVLHEELPEKYFEAPLWGTVLSAAKDAVIVFYSVTREENGTIQDVDFNFVAREEFEKTYNIL